MNTKLLNVLWIPAIILSGCGGSDPSTAKQVKTGVFVDSTVANLSYQTATKSGTTNADGEFNYIEGETVTFSIGDLDFPPVKAQEIITPVTVSGGESIYDPVATNIAILLQSLDEDGDPTLQGIVIPDGAALNASSTIVFDVPTADFATNQEVIDMVALSGSATTTLETEGDVQSHFQTSLDLFTPHVGAWSSSDGTSHLILYADDTFLYAENDVDLPNGVELGTYSFDSISGNATLSITYDNNGPGEDSGVGDIGTSVVVDAVLSGNNDIMTILGGELVFNAADFSGAAIAGSWRVDSSSHLILFADGTFIHAENDGDAPNGLEMGTYVFNAGNITFTITYDDNGPGTDSGIGDIGTPVVIDAVLSNNNNTLSIVGGLLVFTRSL